MKLTVTTVNDLFVTHDVSPDMELENFKALCECEFGFPSNNMFITHKGRPLLDNKKDLATFGIKDGDVLYIQQLNIPCFRNSLPNFGGTLLRKNNPSLADAFQAGDKRAFNRIMTRQVTEKFERDRKRILMLNTDPFDPGYQNLIAEEIRQDKVDSNMEAAIKYHPESFGQLTMLYINCKVNGHPVRAFIDSGTQTTIMSQACAERCEIMRLVDKRWSGYAKGVGIQKILGRMHLGHIQINDVFLQSSFSILEKLMVDMLLGLDTLKSHQCCIDLKRNILLIGTTGTEIPFLNENELPIHAGHNTDPTKDELKKFSSDSSKHLK